MRWKEARRDARIVGDSASALLPVIAAVAGVYIRDGEGGCERRSRMFFPSGNDRNIIRLCLELMRRPTGNIETMFATSVACTVRFLVTLNVPIVDTSFAVLCIQGSSKRKRERERVTRGSILVCLLQYPGTYTRNIQRELTGCNEPGGVSYSLYRTGIILQASHARGV